MNNVVRPEPLDARIPRTLAGAALTDPALLIANRIEQNSHEAPT